MKGITFNTYNLLTPGPQGNIIYLEELKCQDGLSGIQLEEEHTAKETQRVSHRMIAPKGREACRLSVMLVWLHLLTHVSGRPARVPSKSEEETRPTRQPSPRPCREVPVQELWIRLDSAQFYARQTQEPTMSELVPNFAPAPEVSERPSLRRPRSLHSNLASVTSHSTPNTAHDTTPEPRRHDRKLRRQEAKRRRRNEKARKKFLRKAANISKPEKLKKLFSGEREQWQCQFRETWADLGSDYFPRKVRTGSCEQTECMFGFYQCREKRYWLPVLKRDRLHCNPLPSLGPNTEYEEAWVSDGVDVVVGCECSPLGTSTGTS